MNLIEEGKCNTRKSELCGGGNFREEPVRVNSRDSVEGDPPQ